MPPRDGPPPSAQTAERALSLLDVLADNGGHMRLSDLAEAATLNISTVSRLLGALERAGLVERDQDSGRYRLGLKLLRLAQAVLDQAPLPEMANPILARLMEATGETATLCVLHDDGAVVVARAECTSPLRSVARIGDQGPLYCTAHGKAILATMPAAAVERILAAGMPPLTDLTITTPAAMAAELERVRGRGYALDLGEREPGLVSIAAAVYDAAGRAVGTCGVSGSQQRMADEAIPGLAAEVASAAAHLSDRLGRRSPEGGSEPRGWRKNGAGAPAGRG